MLWAGRHEGPVHEYKWFQGIMEALTLALMTGNVKLN